MEMREELGVGRPRFRFLPLQGVRARGIEEGEVTKNAVGIAKVAELLPAKAPFLVGE